MSNLCEKMQQAISQSKLTESSTSQSDIPVGCVIFCGDNIIGKGYNTREAEKSVIAHAEIKAISEACQTIGDWRLPENCELFVTLEPCPMCAGAIKAARIKKVYYGSRNLKEGAAGTIYNILFPETKVYGGICAEECDLQLKEFFEKIRDK